MSQYIAAVPSDGSVSKEIVSFFENFYKISDSPTAHEEYANALTPNGHLIMGSNETTGILSMRQTMWSKVASRSHYPARIFPFGSQGDEVMLYGKVDYVLKDGKKAEGIEWAARAKLERGEGKIRMSEYQVYLDSAAMAAKAK